MDDVFESIEENAGHRKPRLTGVQHKKEDNRHCCLVLSKLSRLRVVPLLLTGVSDGDDEEQTVWLKVPPAIVAAICLLTRKGCEAETQWVDHV